MEKHADAGNSTGQGVQVGMSGERCQVWKMHLSSHFTHGPGFSCLALFILKCFLCKRRERYWSAVARA